jgi:hypothetical protein
MGRIDFARKFVPTVRIRNGCGPFARFQLRRPFERVYPMFPGFRHFRLTPLFGLLILLAEPVRAAAGWMGFRNDTGMTLVIQETVTVGAGTRQGKPQKIFANETIRDTPPVGGGQRMYTISESGHTDKSLYSGNFASPAANENVLYVIKLNAKGVVEIEAIKSPVATPKKPPTKK